MNKLQEKALFIKCLQQLQERLLQLERVCDKQEYPDLPLYLLGELRTVVLFSKELLVDSSYRASFDFLHTSLLNFSFTDGDIGMARSSRILHDYIDCTLIPSLIDDDVKVA